MNLILKRRLESCSSCRFDCYVRMHTFDTKAARMKFHLAEAAKFNSPFASRLS